MQWVKYLRASARIDSAVDSMNMQTSILLFTEHLRQHLHADTDITDLFSYKFHNDLIAARELIDWWHENQKYNFSEQNREFSRAMMEIHATKMTEY